MIEPSIRGSIFRSAVEELERERERGRVDAGALEAALEAEDLEILDGKILDGAWYPLATYGRVIDLLCRCVAGGSRVYHAERGARNAQRLMDAGAYAQLDLLERFTEGTLERDAATPQALAESMRVFKEKVELVVSLAGTIYNVGRWSVADDADAPEQRVCIEIHEAADYTDGMRLAIEGFFNQCVRAVPGTGLTRLFRSERLDADHIRVRMTMDLKTVLESVRAERRSGGDEGS